MLPGSPLTARFDVVFVFDAIHDQVEPDTVLTRIAAALVPGGLLFMREPRAAETLAGQSGQSHGGRPVLGQHAALHDGLAGSRRRWHRDGLQRAAGQADAGCCGLRRA